MDSITGENRDFDQFVAKWWRLFRLAGIALRPVTTNGVRLLRLVTIVCQVLVTWQLISYASLDPEASLTEKTVSISYSNYFLGALGKLLTLIRNEQDLLQCIESFRSLYPRKQDVRKYELEGFLRQWKLVELLLLTFMRVVVLSYCGTPIVMGLVQWALGSPFEYPPLFGSSSKTRESVFLYTAVYALQTYSTYIGALIIVCCDLCLFSLLIQLCMHFDLIAKRIAEIDASTEEAEQQLKDQIAYHYRILDLCDEVNRIFAPSMSLSLISSSFILCFTLYQLLDDAPALVVIKAIILLLYELKQVIITCYYGEMLMQNSGHLFDVLYSHNWVDGSPRYKKMVLIAICRMRHPSALNVAKLSDLNLQTLKQVLSNAYQVFTVLKTT